MKSGISSRTDLWCDDKRSHLPSLDSSGRRDCGATANYAFSAEPRGSALFLQSTCGNLQRIIAAELTRNGYPTFLGPGALAMGSVVPGENLFAYSPVETIRKAGVSPCSSCTPGPIPGSIAARASNWLRQQPAQT